ncbi:MAG: sulfotransferase [Planctomycetaceae bacterium]
MKLSGVARLLTSRPSMHVSRLHRILPLPLFGAYNSTMAAIEDLIYGRAVAETRIEQPPLFVLGYWRSGTTLLQTLLAHDRNFQYLNLYQALFPWHFLLTEKVTTKLTARFVPKARPMDNMQVSWDSPQEDDMASCVMSGISPCSVVSHPHDYRHFWKALSFDTLSETELNRWKSCFLTLLKKLTYRSNKRVLLKSPYHTFHIPTLLEMFPEAKFVYIHRHPYHVFRSACHLRHRMIAENTLGRDLFINTEEEVIRSYRRGFELYERDRLLIPDGNLCEVSFEQLECDPLSELERVYASLNLPGFDDVAESVTRELPSLQRYRKNKFPNDPEWAAVVYEQLRDAFERFCYEAPETSDLHAMPAA